MKKIKITGTLLVLFIAIFTLGGLKASASTLDLSEGQKLEYYKQYEKIVNEINLGEPNSTLELEPFEKYTSKDFVEPLEFKKYAIERANVMYNIVSDGITPFSTVSASKSKTVTSNGTSVGLTIKGSFTTNYDSLLKKQMFFGVNSITVTPSKGTWTKSTSSGYSYNLMDMGTTYEITASGTISINNLKSNHNVIVEFYCESDGSVS
ncbi:hypothetical protein ACQKMD_17350 [Viridibacillus sp. NPDC096237]|uniref:hypothetical protein n=1 Tax=Viridibacillus sp. NPDC096237 TaxID=3390721 RepID=UPI003D0525D0